MDKRSTKSSDVLLKRTPNHKDQRQRQRLVVEERIRERKRQESSLHSIDHRSSDLFQTAIDTVSAKLLLNLKKKENILKKLREKIC